MVSKVALDNQSMANDLQASKSFDVPGRSLHIGPRDLNNMPRLPKLFEEDLHRPAPRSLNWWQSGYLEENPLVVSWTSEAPSKCFHMYPSRRAFDEHHFEGMHVK